MGFSTDQARGACHGDSPPWGQPTTRTYRTSHHGASPPQGHPATGPARHRVACWVKSQVLSLNQQGLGPLLGIGLLCAAGVGTHLGTIYNPCAGGAPRAGPRSGTTGHAHRERRRHILSVVLALRGVTEGVGVGRRRIWCRRGWSRGRVQRALLRTDFLVSLASLANGGLFLSIAAERDPSTHSEWAGAGGPHRGSQQTAARIRRRRQKQGSSPGRLPRTRSPHPASSWVQGPTPASSWGNDLLTLLWLQLSQGRGEEGRGSRSGLG